MLYVCFKLMWIFPSTLRGSSEVLRPYFSKHNEVESMAAHVHLNSAAPKSTSSYSREKLKIILIYAVYCAQLQNSKLIKIERSYSFIGKIPKACFIYRIKKENFKFRVDWHCPSIYPKKWETGPSPRILGQRIAKISFEKELCHLE